MQVNTSLRQISAHPYNLLRFSICMYANFKSMLIMLKKSVSHENWCKSFAIHLKSIHIKESLCKFVQVCVLYDKYCYFFDFRNVKSEKMLLQPKENSTAVASHLFSIRSSPIGLSATVLFTGKCRMTFA